MTRLLLSTAAIALLFATFGCNKSADLDPNVRFSIDDEFNVSLWENLQPDNRQLVFNLSTIKNQDCLNASIDYSIKNQGREIILSINDLMVPTDCLDGQAPANSSVLVGELENGEYPLQINLKEEVVNKGKLKVSHNQYIIQLNSDHGIVLEEKELLRVPVSTIWGFVGYKSSSTATTVDNLMSDMSTHTAPKILNQGNYGHFRINANDEFEMSEQSELAHSQFFVLHLSGQKAELSAVLDDYRARYGGELDIKIYTDQGEKL